MKKLIFLAMFVVATSMAVAQNVSSDNIKVTTSTEMAREYTATGTRTLSTGLQQGGVREIKIDFGDIQADSTYVLKLKGVPVRYLGRQSSDSCYVVLNTDYREIIRVVFHNDDRLISPKVTWDGITIVNKNGKFLSIRYLSEYPIEK